MPFVTVQVPGSVLTTLGAVSRHNPEETKSSVYIEYEGTYQDFLGTKLTTVLQAQPMGNAPVLGMCTFEIFKPYLRVLNFLETLGCKVVATNTVGENACLYILRHE